MVSTTIPVPNGFYCPITKEILQDPVVCADGNTYERGAIEQWFRRPRAEDSNGNPTPARSPLTNLPLPHISLTPNNQLKFAIKSFMENYPDMRYKAPKMALNDVRAAVESFEADMEAKGVDLRAQLRQREMELEQLRAENADLRSRMGMAHQSLNAAPASAAAAPVGEVLGSGHSALREKPEHTGQKAREADEWWKKVKELRKNPHLRADERDRHRALGLVQMGIHLFNKISFG